MRILLTEEEKKERLGIYKITSPSGRIYIGQSMNLERRINEYKKLNNCKGQSKLYLSLIKYGAENHIYEIIELCDLKIINERERFWQEYFECVTKGLNCILVKTSEKKMIVSDEVRKKMSESGKGKKQSDEHINKRVISKKGYIHSDETKNKIALKQNKILLDLNTGIFYDSILIASKVFDINTSTLRAMLSGRFKNKTSLIHI